MGHVAPVSYAGLVTALHKTLVHVIYKLDASVNDTPYIAMSPLLPSSVCIIFLYLLAADSV